ncbi:hypothetical protein TNCV_3199131 [Trichonephila clavipes]|nr:hypothetical protein TNCV_3199131 [Trichonephila clavipes]
MEKKSYMLLLCPFLPELREEKLSGHETGWNSRYGIKEERPPTCVFFSTNLTRGLAPRWSLKYRHATKA